MRGNAWTTVDIKLGPEEDKVADELRTQFNLLIDKYEVKLGATGGYKATPDGTGNINPQEVIEEDVSTASYKGFKHDLGDANKEINRITIHGQIADIPDLRDGGTIDNKRFVYVYFKKDDTDYERPLLICLSRDGNPGADNKWYKRTGGTTWQKDKTLFQGIKPGGDNGTEIKNALKNQLATISGQVGADPGYEKPDLIVKLDYAAKSDNATNAIKYRTGNIQVTVEGLTPNGGFKGYKHDLTDQVTINAIKIHNTEIEQINGSALQNKQFVYVYFENNDTELKKPYLICLSKTGRKSPDNKWYQREKSGDRYTWSTAPEFNNSDNPNSIDGLAERLGTIETGLESTPYPGYNPSSSNDIDASVTPTNTTAANGALYGIGTSQINVTKDTNTTAADKVPQNYVRYKHTSTTTFTLSSIKHNDKVLNGIDKTLNPRTLRITQRRLDKSLPESDLCEL